MNWALNLFTALVFLLVITLVYTMRALGKRQRRAAAALARLTNLQQQVQRERQAPPLPGSIAAAPAAAARKPQPLVSVTVTPDADSILLAQDAALLPWWPWLGERLGRLRRGVRLLGWQKNLRQRIALTLGAALIGGLLLGRMTPAPLPATLFATVLLFGVISTLTYRAAMAVYLEALGRSLPEAIDAITRVCRAGVPLHSAFAIAADHLQSPLVNELRAIDHWLRLGVPIRQAMQDSARRVPLPAYRFFAVILIISQESGGRLGDTLERLSATLRSRAELHMKVAAKTSEARASSKIVALLVPGVLAYMYLNAPDDFRFLVSDPTGIKVMLYAAISVCIGLLTTHFMVRRVR